MRQVRHATGQQRRWSADTSKLTARRARQLGKAIDRNRHEIERLWLERVQRDVNQTGVEPTQLRDGLPDYLVALVELLSKEGRRPGGGPPSESAWWKVAREHGITRVRIGFDISQLIHEFVILRQVIREIAHAEGVYEDTPDAVLADILEAGVIAAVQAYVDARDFEARRQQAEHIGFLTHELRNPLSTAMLAVEKLRAHALPEQEHLLDMIERNHTRLNQLIDGVLATEKLDSGKVEPHPVRVRLGQIMDGALEAARATATQKGLAFHTDYDRELVLHVDPGLTRSAIQNVADNAVRYTDHGEVDVTVERNRDGDGIEIHVRDACEGISDEEMRTIFEPFKRGSTGKSGTGLGLAIARRAIRIQGGDIEAESKDRSGCHFCVRLPHCIGE